jgi:4-amino-4-deoxy-L-arabinose transferase-like glycosyltransferase
LNFNKKIWSLILLSSMLRIWVAASLELGNDEVYYQAYARHLQWNYFDHPPMVAVLIRLSTFNLYFHNEFFIRLGSILCAAAGTWLIFSIGRRIGRPRTGWIAAILYNTSFYTSIIAGTFILPDSPQVVFWLMSMYFMIGILDYRTTIKKQRFDFILLGISIGLCIMSKIHGVFLWLGFGAYIIFHRRDLLKLPMLWISGIISIGIIYPIYYWNRLNHFITYNYHEGRIRFLGSSPDLDRVLQQVLGSVFYSNPINFVMYVITIWAIIKGKINGLPKVYPLLLWLSFPLILVLIWTSMFSETLPHWSGPAYLSLMLLAACWLDEKTESAAYGKWLRTAGWLFVSVIVIGVSGIHYLPFRIGSADEKNLGKGDITLDMYGWHSFAISFDSLYRVDLAAGHMKENATILSDYWFPAGHLDHYYGIPYHHNLLAMGPVNDIHHFAWLNQRRPGLKKGSDAYFIYPSNYYGPPKVSLKNDFALVEDSISIPQYRSGIPVRYFVVYRMHDFKGDSLEMAVPGIH